MENLSHVQSATDNDVENAISVLSNLDLESLPENVKAALQQLALKLLHGTI